MYSSPAAWAKDLPSDACFRSIASFGHPHYLSTTCPHSIQWAWNSRIWNLEFRKTLLPLRHLWNFALCKRFRAVLIHMNAMTHSYECHEFTWVTWLIHMCAMTHPYVCHDLFTWMTSLVHMSAMTHSYECNDSCTWVPWIHMSHVTHPHVRHDSFTWVPWLVHVRVTWLVHISDMTHSHERHGFRISRTESRMGLIIKFMALMWMSHGTHTNESWHSYEWVTALIWMSHGTLLFRDSVLLCVCVSRCVDV